MGDSGNEARDRETQKLCNREVCVKKILSPFTDDKMMLVEVRYQMPTIWSPTVRNHDITSLMGRGVVRFKWGSVCKALNLVSAPHNDKMSFFFFFKGSAFNIYISSRAHSKWQSVDLTSSSVNTQGNSGSDLSWVSARRTGVPCPGSDLPWVSARRGVQTQ